jgi:sec-independent protein translocase protein TatC
MSHQEDSELNQKDMPLVEHLLELRDRLLKIVLTISLIFLALFSFANDLFHILSEPLQRLLPTGSTMVAIDVASPFLTPFKLTMVLSIFLAVPVILYHIWAFVAPGLYKHEKILVLPLLVSSTLLFYLGIVFCYFVVFPLLFAFMASVTPEGVTMMTDISRYLDFVLKMFFAFGVAFEVPIATILLVWVGIVTPDALRAKRPHIIVGVFIIAMLMTPPDVISQTLLAVPILILFEVGLLFSDFILSKKNS